MSFKKLEKERLWDWFVEKHDWKFYRQALKELEEAKKSMGFFKRITVSDEDREFLIERTKELLHEKWEKETGERR